MHKLFWLFLVGDHAFLEFLELAAPGFDQVC